MIYLGHFSFDTKLKGESKTMEPWHANFVAVVEADDIDAALPKFHALVEKRTQDDTFLGKVKDVYLYTCLEIRQIPRAGLIGHIIYEEGETKTLSAVPSLSSRHGDVWEFGSEDEGDSEEPCKIEPFFQAVKSKPAKKNKPAKKGK